MKTNNQEPCSLCGFGFIAGNQYMTSSNEIVCGHCYVSIHGTRDDWYPARDQID